MKIPLFNRSQESEDVQNDFCLGTVNNKKNIKCLFSSKKAHNDVYGTANVLFV